MSGINIFLMIVMIVLFIGFIVTLIVMYATRKQTVLSKGHVTNHIYRFNNNKKYGKLVSTKPVGNNKDLIRLTYATSEVNEFGERFTNYETTIADKKHILKEDEGIVILPKSEHELDEELVNRKKIGDLIRSVNDANVWSTSDKNRYTSFVELYKKNYGKELTEIEIKQSLEIAKLYNKEEPKQEQKVE